MLEQSKNVERVHVKSLTTTPKPEQVIELSIDLDKMVAELTEELDVEALLAEPTEFIRENEYSENLLDDLLNNDDLLDKLQDDLATLATIGIIPLEFANQPGDSWYLEEDVVIEETKCVALVREELEEVRFKKWMKVRYLRPLYIKAHVNGKPINRVLIDGGVMLNIMPYSTFKRLGKSHKDLKETNMTISNFTRASTPALGFLIVELTMGSKMTNIVFFVMDSKPGYTVLLCREWIYANQCVPSTLHQQLQFWISDQVEVDPFHFTTNVRIQDAMLYSVKIEPISQPEDIALDSIKSFDLPLDKFKVIMEVDLWPTRIRNKGT